ncbi:MAG: GNAT family N-acetyltransferase [Nitrospirota bacterium]
MAINESPAETGVSEITGKRVTVRHATEADMPFIEEKIHRYGFDDHNLNHRQFVVAAENGAIIGFGRLQQIGELYHIGCVAVVEERRGMGIGSLIMQHLLDIAPVDMVYVLTDQVDYFRKFGFSEMETGSKELFDDLDSACKAADKQHRVLMVHEKRAR